MFSGAIGTCRRMRGGNSCTTAPSLVSTARTICGWYSVPPLASAEYASRELQRRHRDVALADRHVEREAHAELAAVPERVPRPRRNPPWGLGVDPEAGLFPEPEGLRHARDAVHADRLGEVKEVHVARPRDRVAQTHLSVDVAAPEDAPPEDDVPLALLGVLRVDHVIFERGQRAERLHRRPGWKAPLIVLSSIGRSGSAYIRLNASRTRALPGAA